MGGTLFAGFIGGIIARIPIGFALAAASIVGLLLFTEVPLNIAPQRIVAGITPFPLLAIPLFILAGALMTYGGISRRLLDLAESIVGRIRGGLAQTNVLASLFFGGLSGSAVADVSSLGRILIPAMRERNYSAAYSAVVTAVTAIITPILPPSITLILYGVVTGTSIGQLFFAGVVPAFVFVAILMLTVHLTVNKLGFLSGHVGETKAEGAGHAPKFFPSLLAAFPALLLPVLILVGIRGGFFTPTEAAAMAVVYSLVVGFFIYRELNLKTLIEALKSTVQLVGLIMLVMSAAQLYSWALTSERIPQAIAQGMLDLTSNPVLLLLLINVLLLFVGMFIEANAALIILVPILLPIALDLGVDPVHLGIIIVVNLGIGLVTPPVGLTLLLAAEIAELNVMQTLRALLPFMIAVLAFLMLITYVPAISLWLPTVLF
ncbi:TRAP transporter large permease [Tessaracoccus oleiagri]|uniref:C4-dicarboxylate transporter, DctM subunit n=1 Tax=Tessaracoccus oleiagri TaxID=686624 RepID=A0A1G9I538_9ACTN|nr:TRAP transporter large permease [Tessaracoccus oleiagri]SDL20186.1 C4-dicarboxylate transporter, DctM subunit [Tessaracoccus oleiagri]